MRNFLVNGLLALVSVVVCFVLAEVTVRIIDGQSPVSLILPVAVSSQSINVAGGHLDEVPRASSVERNLFFSDPPPLPNRKPVPADWVALNKELTEKRQASLEAGRNDAFLPWDMFKAWNAAFVGDPCKHPYLHTAPGRLWVYDPPNGEKRPFFRFLPNTTTPEGLVTNEFGWRGPPASFRRSPRTVRIVFVGASTVAEIHQVRYSAPEYLQNWLNRWAEQRKLDVRFEVLNAGRESLSSPDIAALVRQDVAPMRPDLVVYYEGGNQLDLSTIVKQVPKGTPEPGGLVARSLRDMARYSVLARRAEGLMSGGEWPKPPYEITWPKGLDESDPDITRPDLPVNLSTIVHDLDSIRESLAEVGGELSVASWHWLVKDGLVVDPSRQKAILETLNIRFFPYRYRDLERMTKFENRVFAKYDAVHGEPFIDIARYMPHDPELFTDGIHNVDAGVKLKAWIAMQQLVPVIEQRLAAGTWPKPVPTDMPEHHPAFAKPPREITFTCKAS
jgi:hypothetical protein